MLPRMPHNLTHGLFITQMPHLLFPVSDFRQLTKTMERPLEYVKFFHLFPLSFSIPTLPLWASDILLSSQVHFRLTCRGGMEQRWLLLFPDTTLQRLLLIREPNKTTWDQSSSEPTVLHVLPSSCLFLLPRILATYLWEFWMNPPLIALGSAWQVLPQTQISWASDLHLRPPPAPELQSLSLKWPWCTFGGFTNNVPPVVPNLPTGKLLVHWMACMPWCQP